MKVKEKERAFLQELKKIMIKHGVCLVITGDDGGIYCEAKKNFFTTEDVSIWFDKD